jgi:CBS domain-containing protein
MDPKESQSADSSDIETKAVKEIVEPTTSFGTTASVESALNELDAQGSESAPVTDPEGSLVGKVSKDRMIRSVVGRGHDPKTFQVEPEMEKGAEPCCHEDEPIATAEKLMRECDVDELSVVGDEKKLVGKATLGAIEREKTG